jgi:hypothetical protein
MKRIFVLAAFSFFQVGCQINIGMDFYKYETLKKIEVAGTYRYYNDVWKGPMYVLKLDKNGSYIETMVNNGKVTTVKSGKWEFKEKNPDDSHSSLITFHGSTRPIMKREKDGKIFIYSVHSLSEEWYEKIK